MLAIELTFPTVTAGEAAGFEPWTAARRWEQALVAKVQGFGGVVLQRSPALLLVAFGIPKRWSSSHSAPCRRPWRSGSWWQRA